MKGFSKIINGSIHGRNQVLTVLCVPNSVDCLMRAGLALIVLCGVDCLMCAYLVLTVVCGVDSLMCESGVPCLMCGELGAGIRRWRRLGASPPTPACWTATVLSVPNGVDCLMCAEWC